MTRGPGGLRDTGAPSWPCGDSIPRGKACTQISCSGTNNPRTSDTVGCLYVPGRSPMVDTTPSALRRPMCVRRCSSPTVPHPRRPAADLLACLMFPLRPPIFPPRSWLLRPLGSPSSQPSLTLGARAMERPGAHKERETSGSLVASDLTQAHRETSESSRQRQRDAAPRLGSGRERGWGRDR